jgi:hypothetical protein
VNDNTLLITIFLNRNFEVTSVSPPNAIGLVCPRRLFRGAHFAIATHNANPNADTKSAESACQMQ